MIALKTRVFLGSSREAVPIVETLTGLLDHDFDPVPWSADVFAPGSFTIEGLLAEVKRSDLAVFVFHRDDVALIRERKYSITRDNVVFELGLFMSRLGRERCFFLLPRSAADIRIPSDLTGITPLIYDDVRFEKEPKAALTGPVSELKQTFRRLVFGDRTQVSLSGRWHQIWHVKSSNHKKENAGIAELRQMGSSIVGTTESDNRQFMIEGEIERGDMLTGRWYDRERGTTYFGALQLRIFPIPNKMVGKWIGFSHKGKVKSGDWEWTRVDEDLTTP